MLLPLDLVKPAAAGGKLVWAGPPGSTEAPPLPIAPLYLDVSAVPHGRAPAGLATHTPLPSLLLGTSGPLNRQSALPTALRLSSFGPEVRCSDGH